MQIIHETIIKDFVISTVDDYLLGSDGDENCTRAAKEVVVCKDDWNEISKRVLTLAIADRFELKDLLYEDGCDDLLALLLATEAIESAIIVTAIDIFPDWESVILPALTTSIQSAIVRHWNTPPYAKDLWPCLDRAIDFAKEVEANPEDWDGLGYLTHTELVSRL